MLRIVIYLMYPLLSKVSTVRTHESLQTKGPPLIVNSSFAHSATMRWI